MAVSQALMSLEELQRDVIQLRTERDRAIAELQLRTQEMEKMREALNQLKEFKEKVQQQLKVLMEDKIKKERNYNAQVLELRAQILKMERSSHEHVRFLVSSFTFFFFL
jgi:uncharacterized protein (DUF3084 family)